MASVGPLLQRWKSALQCLTSFQTNLTAHIWYESICAGDADKSLYFIKIPANKQTVYFSSNNHMRVKPGGHFQCQYITHRKCSDVCDTVPVIPLTHVKHPLLPRCHQNKYSLDENLFPQIEVKTGLYRDWLKGSVLTESFIRPWWQYCTKKTKLSFFKHLLFITHQDFF